MFAESLLESAGGVRTNQRWTILFSLTLQGALISLLILIPLLQNPGLPRALWSSTVAAPLPPPPLGVSNPGRNAGGPRSPRAPELLLIPPSTIPPGIDPTPDGQGPNTGGTGPDLPRGLPSGVEHSPGPLFDVPAVLPRPAAPPPRRPSIVTEGNVIYRVLPAYPPIAKQIGAQGPVVLHAVIGADGAVQNLRVVSSAHPLLNDAALAAVAQWRFRPYLLNGIPVEVEAQITVNFIMPR